MRGVAMRAVVLLIAISSIAATAFAATRGRAEAPGHRAPSAAGPAPKILKHPPKQAMSGRAKFTFADRVSAARFECRLDSGRWRACRTPVVYMSLAPGRHRFLVRRVDQRGRHGASARFRWTVLEPRDFVISPDLSTLATLYPGAAPTEIAMTLTNPNPVPIKITSLTVSVGADPAGCPSAANLTLTPSSASSTAPLKVPARGSVRLPTPGLRAPAIQLRDLPVNQDACQHTSFPLEFSGSARG